MSNLFLTHHTHSWPGRRPRRPTAANEGQRRPTKMKKGPNDEVFFLKCTIYFLPTTPIVDPDDAHESPQRPTAANEGQRDDNDKPCRLVIVAPVPGCLSI